MRINENYSIALAANAGGANEEIVLGVRDTIKKGAPGNYVTWLCCRGTDYMWGHYFSDVADAAEDFASRVKRGY